MIVIITVTKNFKRILISILSSIVIIVLSVFTVFLLINEQIELFLAIIIWVVTGIQTAYSIYLLIRYLLLPAILVTVDKDTITIFSSKKKPVTLNLGQVIEIGIPSGKDGRNVRGNDVFYIKTENETYVILNTSNANEHLQALSDYIEKWKDGLENGV